MNIHSPKQSWIQLLLIQVGGALSLPVIMIGHLICKQHGWLAAVLTVSLGNISLLFLGLAFANLSLEKQQSTVEHAIHYFGEKGRVILTLLMTFTMLSWFAVQLNMMSLSLGQLLKIVGLSIPSIGLNVGTGVLLSTAMCLGIKAMRGAATLITPLMILALLSSTFFAQGSLPPGEALTAFWMGGLSVVIGGGITAVIDTPTFFQHARSKKDAYVAIILLYGLALPLIEGVGIYLSALTDGDSILEILQIGHGLAWTIAMAIFVFFCGGTTNLMNIYSATISSFSLGKKLGFKTRMISLGILGTIFACFNPLSYLNGMLDVLSLSVGSVGAIMLMNYLIPQKSPRSSLFGAVFGIGAGLTSMLLPYLMTSIVALDAFFTAAGAYLIFNMIFAKEKSYAAQ